MSVIIYIIYINMYVCMWYIYIHIHDYIRICSCFSVVKQYLTTMVDCKTILNHHILWLNHHLSIHWEIEFKHLQTIQILIVPGLLVITPPKKWWLNPRQNISVAKVRLPHSGKGKVEGGRSAVCHWGPVVFCCWPFPRGRTHQTNGVEGIGGLEHD